MSYSTAHKRVYKAHGRAAEHPCVDCGQQAGHWSLRHEAADVRGSGGLAYSEDAADYEPRCLSCHAVYDGIGGWRGQVFDRAGEQNTQAKLTEEQVAEIRARRAGGERQRAIADAFGISASAVSLIVRGKRWAA